MPRITKFPNVARKLIHLKSIYRTELIIYFHLFIHDHIWMLFFFFSKRVVSRKTSFNTINCVINVFTWYNITRLLFFIFLFMAHFMKNWNFLSNYMYFTYFYTLSKGIFFYISISHDPKTRFTTKNWVKNIFLRPFESFLLHERNSSAHWRQQDYIRESLRPPFSSTAFRKAVSWKQVLDGNINRWIPPPSVDIL